MQFRLYVFLIALLFGHTSWGGSSSLGLVVACNNLGCTAQQKSTYLKQISNQCEIENKILKCDELASDSVQKKLLRLCDEKGLCEQTNEGAKTQVLACLRGYKNSLIDTGIALKDMAVGLGQHIDKAWEDIKNNEKVRSEFLTQCNTSLQCKRNLVKDDPRYVAMSDEDLNRISATALFVQVQDRKAYVESMHRSVPNTVPPSAHPNDSVTEEQKAKLMDLAAVIEAKLKKEYQKFSCYSPAAQAEMACYAVGQVIDPTLLAGAAFKGLRAVGAVEKFGKEAEEVAAFTKANQIAANTPRGKFIRKYLKYNPTTVEDNEKWISLAKQGKVPGSYFMSVENSQMKYLNDTLKDKNLVTSLTNYHKELMVTKLQELQKLYPDLKMTMYSDSKTLNIAFSGKIPTDLQQQLAKLYGDVTTEFGAYLKDNKIIRQNDTPEKYFNAAYGTYNDETNKVMRDARDRSPGKMVSYNDPGVQETIVASQRATEIDHAALTQKFGSTKMFDGPAPSAEVFDIVKKNKDADSIKAALKARYKVAASDEDVATLKRYVNNVDSFSLNPYTPVREFANLNSAVHGGFSMDFAGLGSQNLKGTADALTKSADKESALLNSRAAEQAVTDDLNQKKQFFSKIAKESVEPGKLKTVCSGDDCVAVATKPLTDQEKQKILNRVADSKYTSKMRFSFVNDGVRGDDARNILSTHGESIEKLLRKNLSSVIDTKKLDALTFGVDMRTQELNQGSVKLIVGQGQDLYLTKVERQRIQRVFKETVDQFNQSITFKDKPPARYEASP